MIRELLLLARWFETRQNTTDSIDWARFSIVYDECVTTHSQHTVEKYEQPISNR